MGANSLPKTVTRQRRDCDLNLGPLAPEFSTLTTRLLSHHHSEVHVNKYVVSIAPFSTPACRVGSQNIT